MAFHKEGHSYGALIIGCSRELPFILLLASDFQ